MILFRTKSCLQNWICHGPFRLIAKIIFWAINLIAGGAHLQGTVNGLALLFPGLKTADNGQKLKRVAIPFQFGDASSHVATSVLGSNEMIDGVARSFEKNRSFWGTQTTLLKKVLLSLLALFLVTTAEVSSTYRNWQNNAGDALSLRIFWVAFYLASHIPEVLYSTMLMVKDYFNGFRLNARQEEQIAQITFHQVQQYWQKSRISALCATDRSHDDSFNEDFSDDSQENDENQMLENFYSQRSLDSEGHRDADEFHDHDFEDQFLFVSSPKTPKIKQIDFWVKWTTRVIGVLLSIPTFAVKAMSSVKGFQVITHADWLSWTLGISGMLAEAYLEYSFTQTILDEIVTALIYKWQKYHRLHTCNLFYIVMPHTYWALVILTIINGFLTVPGSYNSAHGAIPAEWGGWQPAICWLYAVRFILQAITGCKLILENIILTVRANWNPQFYQLLQNIKKRKEKMLRKFQMEQMEPENSENNTSNE